MMTTPAERLTNDFKIDCEKSGLNGFRFSPDLQKTKCDSLKKKNWNLSCHSLFYRGMDVNYTRDVEIVLKKMY